MYIRNLRKPSGNKNVYKFASAKNRCVVMCEGSLERDCCYHFEYSPDVVWYKSQPQGFTFQFENKVHPYTPDFLVYQSDGVTYFVEVKPYWKIFDDSFKRSFSLKQIAANELGTPLILVTDKQIRNGIYLENLKLIHRYSGHFEDTILLSKVCEILHWFQSISIQSISESLKFSIGDTFATVLRLIFLGKAKVNLDEVLDKNAVIMAN